MPFWRPCPSSPINSLRPERPLLFGTTEQFLRTFGIESLDELPETDAVKMEEFRQEAEEEAGTRLDI